MGQRATHRPPAKTHDPAGASRNVHEWTRIGRGIPARLPMTNVLILIVLVALVSVGIIVWIGRH
jgi:hypothetical protein